MSEEILINVTPPETRVAIVENGVVQEIIIERAAKRGLVGNIYKGRICRAFNHALIKVAHSWDFCKRAFVFPHFLAVNVRAPQTIQHSQGTSKIIRQKIKSTTEASRMVKHPDWPQLKAKPTDRRIPARW